MLGIVAKLKSVMPDLDEAKLLIEGQCPGIIFPDAKPDLISVAAQRGSEHFGHERLRDTFAVPLLVNIDALEFGWPRRHHARRRSSPSKLSVTNEFDFVVAHERFDLRIGDFGGLNGLAIGVGTVSVHVLARIRGGECRPKGTLCENR